MVKKNMDETTKGFMKHNGGLSLKRVDSSNYEFNVEVKDYHLNSGKFAHGGFLATIADTGMGTAAHQIAENKRCVTINLDIKYIAAQKGNRF
jgi:acyl-coenzyme A thioesterase PaaI-like protein